MTTVVTTTGNNWTAIFADSGLTSDIAHPDIRKITQQGKWLISFAGDARQADVLHYLVKYPNPPKSLITKPREEWFAWIVRKVIPLMENALNLKDKEEYNFEGLIVTHGHAFYIATSFAVSSAEPYWAIGSGSHLAIGYLASAQYDDNWNKDHDLKSRYAVSVAGMHDEATRGKIHGFVSYRTGHIQEA
jgi:ATP-dependent protease HslVU (ClpYQ) peptidase subunit